VKAGDPLAEVETDKATLEMEAYVGGTVLKVLVPDGGTAKVGAAIAVIGPPGADWQAAAGAAGGPEAPHAAGEAAHERQAALPKIPEEQPGRGDKVIWRPSRPVGTDALESPSERHNEAAMHAMIGPVRYQPGLVAGEIMGVTFGFGAGLATALRPLPRAEGVRVRATPLARKLAEERGIDLAAVGGSGPGGRIVKADVEGARPPPLRAVPPPAPEARAPAAAPAAPAAAPAPAVGQTVPLSQMRKAIARAMAQAKREIPHFYLTVDVDMAAAVALRKQAKAADVSVSPNDLVLRAVAVAAKEVPQVLGVFREDLGAIEIPSEVHLGFATALEDGLITPVIRDAGRLPLGEIARQVRELAAKARDKKLKPEDYQGATITVSNLGMYDIEHFYAIVNPPQSSIVSVGKLREEPVVKDGDIVVGQRMRLGYSGDHRVVDGAVGAKFLQAVKRALENPLKMLLG
jgi:pyruvate dehydrogenase E2 component (dihydrolipoamide acetyltransferase)